MCKDLPQCKGWPDIYKSYNLIQTSSSGHSLDRALHHIGTSPPREVVPQESAELAKFRERVAAITTEADIRKLLRKPAIINCELKTTIVLDHSRDMSQRRLQGVEKPELIAYRDKVTKMDDDELHAEMTLVAASPVKSNICEDILLLRPMPFGMTRSGIMRSLAAYSAMTSGVGNGEVSYEQFEALKACARERAMAKGATQLEASKRKKRTK